MHGRKNVKLWRELVFFDMRTWKFVLWSFFLNCAVQISINSQQNIHCSWGYLAPQCLLCLGLQCAHLGHIIPTTHPMPLLVCVPTRTVRDSMSHQDRLSQFLWGTLLSEHQMQWYDISWLLVVMLCHGSECKVTASNQIFCDESMNIFTWKNAVHLQGFWVAVYVWNSFNKSHSRFSEHYSSFIQYYLSNMFQPIGPGPKQIVEVIWINELLYLTLSAVILVICNITGINYFKISFSSWIISLSSFEQRYFLWTKCNKASMWLLYGN
jgi:hypothetical protein